VDLKDGGWTFRISSVHTSQTLFFHGLQGSTRLACTGLRGGLEHLKIETRLIDERFVSVMGECVIWTPQVCRRYSK